MEHRYLIKKSTLTNIADIVREKNQITGQLNLEEIEFCLDALSNESEEKICQEIVKGVVTVPNLVLDWKMIPDYTFAMVQGIEELTFTDPELEIGINAFWKSSLKKINLNNTMVTIPKGIFQESQLTELILPNADKVITIGENAFYGSQLSTINDKELVNLTTIEPHAFQNTPIASFQPLGSKIKDIGTYAFRSCYNLRDIPSLRGVEYIGDAAFQGVTINGYSNYTDENGRAIEIVNFYSAKTIGASAFRGVEVLDLMDEEGNVEKESRVTLASKEVLTIDNQAFQEFQCTNLLLSLENIKFAGRNIFRLSEIKNLHMYASELKEPNILYNWLTQDLHDNFATPFYSTEVFNTSQTQLSFQGYEFKDILEARNGTTIKKYTLCGLFRPFATNFESIEYIIPNDGTFKFCEHKQTPYGIVEIQQRALAYTSISSLILSNLQILDKWALQRAFLCDYEDPTRPVVIQFGTTGNPVKSIDSAVFDGIYLPTVNGELLIDNLEITVYYDNRDYSETGYPEDYSYGEDGLPTGWDSFWGIPQKYIDSRIVSINFIESF